MPSESYKSVLSLNNWHYQMIIIVKIRMLAPDCTLAQIHYGHKIAQNHDAMHRSPCCIAYKIILC